MEKQRTIQEYVPGKQVTLAHLIANPDRFSGTLLLTGDFASVESSLKAVLAFLQETLKFYICDITRS